jgi:hypothetical protein
VALSLAFGAPVLAQAQLEESAVIGLTELGFDASQFEPLSVEQAAEIENVLGSSESEAVKIARIEEIIGANAGAEVGEAEAEQLRDSVAAEMAELGVDTSGAETLSVAQLTEIEAVTSSNETEEAKRAQIQQIVGTAPATAVDPGVEQLRESVAADMTALGMPTDAVDGLSLAQLAQIENITAAGDSNGDKRAHIERVLAE